MDCGRWLTWRYTVRKNPYPSAALHSVRTYLRAIWNSLPGKIKKAGLIKSTRGAQGGYRLAKPAAEISVGDILRALEGELGAVDCQGLKPEGGCESSDLLRDETGLAEDQRQHAKAVDEITLEELMAEAKKSQERKREMEQSGQYINSQDKADTKRKC